MRQTELFKNYGFHCDCPLCTTAPSFIGDFDKYFDDPLALRDALRIIRCTGSDSKVLSMDSYLTAINEDGVSFHFR